MVKFTSGLSATMEAMLTFKEIHGYSRKTHEPSLTKLDRFCTNHYPNATMLTKEVVLDWLEVESRPKRNGIYHKACAVRQFGKYLVSVSKNAYVLPDDYLKKKSAFTPHLFTDTELTALFEAIDTLSPNAKLPFIHVIAPVLFRLLYTCGLRPNEGRELKCANINLGNGEILIVNNKRKKQRLVVMSGDMLDLCRNYDLRRNAFAGSNTFFFPNVNDEPYNHIQVRTIFKQCWAAANLETSETELPNVRPYDLRHRFASAVLHKWLNEGRDLYAMLPYLRSYMGQEHISDTAYYIHVLPENLLKSQGVNWDKLDEIVPEVNVWEI